jgi:pyruvate,water dikinase
MRKPFFTFIFLIILNVSNAQNYRASLADYSAYKAFRGKPLSLTFLMIITTAIQIRAENFYWET